MKNARRLSIIVIIISMAIILLSSPAMAQAPDPLNVELSAATFSSAEGISGTVASTVSLLVSGGNVTTGGHTVTLAVSGGSATASVDYTATTTIDIPVADYTAPQTVPVPVASLGIIGDAIVEGNETFGITISAGTATTLADINGGGIQSVATYTITDDDGTATVTIADQSLAEGNAGTANMVITATLDKAIQAAATISYTLGGGTATGGTDYNATGGTFNFAAGSSAGATTTFNVPINGDTVVEANETFVATLTNSTNPLVTAIDTATGTITDDDSLLVELDSATASSLEGNSGTSAVDFNLLVTGQSAISTTINLSTTNGTASSGSDFTLSGTPTITIPAGTYSSSTVAIPTSVLAINGDTSAEDNEDFTASLTSPGSGVTIGDANSSGSTQTSVIYTIINDETRTVTLDAFQQTPSGTETTTLTFRARASGNVNSDQTVNWAVTGSGANPASAADFTGGVFPSGTVTIPDNSRNGIISITLTNDTFVEFNETFTVTLSNPSPGLALGVDITETGTITNNDTATITIGNPATTSEEAGTIVFPINTSAQVDVPFTLTYNTTGGTATSGTDFTAASNATLNYNLSGGVTSISINLTSDVIVESNEQFTVTISNLTPTTVGSQSNALALGGTTTGTGTISSDDVVLVELDTSTNSGNEGNTAGPIASNLKFIYGGGVITQSAITVNVTRGGGTSDATLGTDYSGTGSITIPAGNYTSTNGTTTFPVGVFGIIGDSITENDETVQIVLSSPGTGAQLGDVNNDTTTSSSTYYTIIDDDTLTVQLSAATASTDEGNSGSAAAQTALTLTVSGADTSGGSDSSIDISLGDVGDTATLTSDYTQSNATVTIAKGDYTSATPINIPLAALGIVGDTTAEANETLSVSLANPSNIDIGATSSSTLTITNDDPIRVNLTATSATKAEGSSGTTNYTFTVTADFPVNGAKTLDYEVTGVAVTPADFVGGSLPSGTVTINDGATTGTITVAVEGDTIVEPNETFTVTISNPSSGLTLTGGTTTANGIIQNDDSAVISINNPSALENAGPISFTVSVDNAVQGGFVVDVATSIEASNTAEVADFTAKTQTLTFTGTVNETKAFTVTVANDNVTEADETFTATLSQNAGTALPANVSISVSNGSGTGTITNDDIATISVSPNSALENTGTLQFTVSVDKAVDGGFFVDIATSIEAGDDAEVADFTASSTTLSFNGTVNETETFSVTLATDTVVEADETFTVTLSENGINALPTGVVISGSNDSATGTITNDDTATISINDVTAAENLAGGTFTFTTTLTGAVEDGFTVQYATSGGTATQGTDYTAASGTHNFAGTLNETKSINVTINNDNIVEPSEAFTFVLSNLILASANADDITFTDTTGTGTITNDDTSSITVSDVSANENGSTFTFNITMSNPVSSNVVIGYTTSDDTATTADDYTAASGTLTYTPGQTSKQVTVTVSGDTKVENNETFNFIISGNTIPANVSITDAQGIGTIQNDDSANISVSDVSANENGGTFTFNITMSAIVDATVTVNYATFDSTATTLDTDYQSKSGQLVFTSGQTSKQVTVTVEGDVKVEADETFNLTVGNLVSTLSGNVNILDATGVGTITNDDTATVSINTVTLPEGDTIDGTTNFQFIVSVDKEVDGGFNINYATGGGTATAGSDYTAITTTALPFTGIVNEQKPINVTVIGDDVIESNETFNVNISKGTISVVDAADIVISISAGVGTITNDDFATLSITSEETIEANTSLDFTVTLNKQVDSAFIVRYATVDNTATGADNDFVALTSLQDLNFTGNAGEQQTISITINQDTKVEPDELFAVVLWDTNNSGVAIGDGVGARFGVGKIINDDSATVTIADANITEGNSDTTNLTFTATLNSAVQGGFTVSYSTANGTASTADGDYTAKTGNLTFAGTANETKTVTVSIAGDTKVEPDETFFVNLTGASKAGVTASDNATGTITNNDTATITIANVSVTEGDSDTTDISFTATLNNAVQGGFTVNYTTVDGTAVAGVDYVATSGSLTWAGTAGETKSISVTINNDLLIEPDKSFTLELSGISGAIVNVSNISLTSGTATIENNDGSSLRINNVTLDEGDNGTTTFTFELSIDKAVSGGFDIDYATSNGSATAGSDYTADSGTITFAGTINEVQTLSIDVTGDTLVEGNETFNVTLSNATSPDVSIATSVGVGTIANDDNATLTINDVTLDEGDSGTTVYAFDVTLDTNVSGGFTVNYATEEDTATAGSDFIAASGTIGFAGTANETETINVTVYGDPITEPTEVFNVVLSNISNSGVEITDVGVGTITNDDSVGLSIANATRIEGNSGTSNLNFVVTLNDTVQGGFTVDYATSNGTATTADNDYAAKSGTLTFTGTSGEEQTISVAVNGDVKVEADETLTITLSNPSTPGVNISVPTATGTITNDDSTSVIISDVSQYEGNSGTSVFSFTATLNDTVVGGFTVNYATSDGTAIAGSDYVSASGTLSFNGTAGESKTINITVNGDTLAESNETFTLSLSNVSNTDITISDIGTGTILNDEFGIISNGGFEIAGSKQKEALDWNYKGPSIKADRRQCNKDTNGDGIDDKILAGEGNCAFRFYYNPDYITPQDGRKIKQKPDVSGISAGDTIIFDGLVSAINFEGSAKIVVKAVYTPLVDVQKFVIKIDKGSYGYKAISGSMVLEKTPPKLVVIIKVRGQTKGSVWFDGINITHIVNTAPVATRGNQVPLELPPPPSNFRN